MIPGPLHDPEDAYAHLRSLLDGASQGILTVSAAGRILLANRRAEEMFGYSCDELLGQDLDVLLPEAYSRTHRASVAAYFAQPRVRAMGAGPDLTARRKDGSGFTAEIGLSFVPSRAGVVAMAIVSDISERVRTRELLERANKDLLRSNADLEQFASLVSHDLREPLRTVAGYLQLLEKRYAGSLDAEALEWIRNAVDGSERMAGMIREFLELSSVGTRPLNRVHVASADIVRAALHNLQAAIGETRAEIETGALPGIIADPALLAMTFQNLFANALKFRGASMPRVQIGAVKRELDWMFWVRDNGIGFPPDHAGRIFGMFERLRPDDFPGHGAGLAIAKKIVERHGGRIWAESIPGEGSTFFFSIPE
jgi:PAS domain S-box-containing protein